jgi:hypothetical protein
MGGDHGDPASGTERSQCRLINETTANAAIKIANMT